MLQVRLEVTNGYTVCRPAGELDAYSAPGLRQSMALLTSVPRLVVDLSEVPFIDSAGLVALVAGIRRVRDDGGRVVVCSAQRHVQKLLDVVGFGTVVNVARNLDEAYRMLTRTSDPDGNRRPPFDAKKVLPLCAPPEALPR